MNRRGFLKAICGAAAAVAVGHPLLKYFLPKYRYDRVRHMMVDRDGNPVTMGPFYVNHYWTSQPYWGIERTSGKLTWTQPFSSAKAEYDISFDGLLAKDGDEQSKPIWNG